MATQMNIRTLAVAAALSAASLAVSGGTAGAAATFEINGKKVQLDQSLRDKLPDDVKKKNKLTFTTDAAAPPRTFVDEKGQLAGVIPDLLNAIGATLGVDIAIEKNSFDAEVPGVQSGRFDSTTGTGDFPARRAVLDMVDYYKAGYLYLVAGGNPKKVTNDLMSQCGLRVGVIKGTTQETLVTKLSEECVAKGNKPVELQSFNNVLLQVPLVAGRVDVVWENTSTGFKVAAESPDKFAVAGDPIYPAYLGFGISKNRPQLRDALQTTTQRLLDTGIYGAIFEKWKQKELMMDYISINSDPRK
jgi:polar amino acid transport system substrate-binding protein